MIRNLNAETAHDAVRESLNDEFPLNVDHGTVVKMTRLVYKVDISGAIGTLASPGFKEFHRILSPGKNSFLSRRK